MKTLLLLMAMMPCSIAGFCQTVQQTKATTVKIDSVVSVAKDVAMFFGPEWFQWATTPSVSDKQKYSAAPNSPQMSENIGREYYNVTFNYDSETTKAIKYLFAAKVYLWSDTCEPFYVGFGNGLGKLFNIKTYKEWEKGGIKKSDTTPFDPIPEVIINKKEASRNE